MSSDEPFSINDYWGFLSPATKNRWWKETDYGRNPPSEELKATIVAEAMTKFSG